MTVILTAMWQPGADDLQELGKVEETMEGDRSSHDGVVLSAGGFICHNYTCEKSCGQIIKLFSRFGSTWCSAQS